MVCLNQVNGIFSLMTPTPRLSQYVKFTESNFYVLPIKCCEHAAHYGFKDTADIKRGWLLFGSHTIFRV